MADEKKEERLNNDEFRELIPYLSLEDLFLIQIKKDKEWVHMVEGLLIDNKEVINCNLCKKHVQLEDFKRHLKEQTHKEALKVVQQFYHAVYTYDKVSEKLAMGDTASEKEIAEAIKIAKAGLAKQPKALLNEAKRLSTLAGFLDNKKIICLQVDEIMKIKCLTKTGHKFPLIIESRNDFVRCQLCQTNEFNDFEQLNVHLKTPSHLEKSNNLKSMSLEGFRALNRNSIVQADVNSPFAIEYNKVLISLLEKENVSSPSMMRLYWDLVYEDILKLEFSNKKRWKPIFRILPQNSNLIQCMLCNKTLTRFSLTSHCGGKQHKTAQLATYQVRHLSFKNLTKNYIFSSGPTNKIKTSLLARKKYHDKVLEILNKEKKVTGAELKNEKDGENKSLEVKKHESRQEDKTELGKDAENDDAKEPEDEESNNNTHTRENVADITYEQNEQQIKENQTEEDETEENKAGENKAEENEAEENLTEGNEAEEIEAEENEAVEHETEENEGEEYETRENEADENAAKRIEGKENAENAAEEKSEENIAGEKTKENRATENHKLTKQSEENIEKAELSTKVAAKAKALRDASRRNSSNTDHTAKIPRNEKLKPNSSAAAQNITNENALIGVEYVVKIVKHPNDKEPMYECCLCEVELNHYRMQNHLVGYNHRYKYIEMHYANAFNKFSGYLKDVKHFDMFRTMGPILSKLAFEIEKVNGRSIPYAVSAQEFEADRARIIAKLYGEKHACQLFGPSFTNILTEKDIEKIKAEKDTYQTPRPDKIVHCRFREIENGQTYCNVKVKGERKVVFDIRGNKRERERPIPKDFEDKPSKRSRVESPPRRRESSMNNVWQKYRREILLSASEIERDYDDYRKCPDSHPMYDKEWNRFWKNRKNDLVSRGIDPRSYDFQSEWVSFFKDRLEQLFGEALEQAKNDIRVRLNIPLDAIEDSNLSIKKSSSNVRREPRTSRVNTEDLVMEWNSQRNYGQKLQRNYVEENAKSKEKKFATKIRDVDDKPDLIHVLRLMTAFEDYLGSLGPKITDLLFSTLTLEKQIPNDINLLEQKILTSSNCSLLETAMEKLKGTLLAGLLDSSKEPGLHRVIDCTTNLLSYADSMGYLKQFPLVQNIPQGNRNPQISSNIEELMKIMSGGKSAVPNRLDNSSDFSGRNPYAPPNAGNRFPDFQNQQFGNMRNSADIASKVSMGTTEVLSAALQNRFVRDDNNASRDNYSSPQMHQRNMNMTGHGTNTSATMNMGNAGRNNYNNPNLNNQNANNRNNPSNKGNMQNSGMLADLWKPFPGGNVATGGPQQNSNGRMWQQNNGNSWQSDNNMSGMQQHNFRQQHQKR